MRRAFDIDVLACPRCGGRMRLLATIEDPQVIRKILAHLGLPTLVSEHAHGDQCCVVIAGRLDLTVNGETRTYGQGDAYFIPAGAPHSARLHAGLRAVDYFADKSRYRVRPGGQ